MNESRITTESLICGTNITEAAAWAVALSKFSGLQVKLTFNEKDIVITPKSTIQGVVYYYQHPAELRKCEQPM